MTNTPIISSERLDLIPLTPAFLHASLQHDSTTAEALLGLAVPSEWFAEHRLMQIRLNNLHRHPALQPWLLRAIGLHRQQIMIGPIGFHSQPSADYWRDLASGGVEYGYTVFSAFRRQGYAREACEALMRWAYQFTPHDNWDYDATATMILADIEIGGRPRKTLVSFNKNGFQYTLDRATGEVLSAPPFVTVTWATSIDLTTGRPVLDPANKPAPRRAISRAFVPVSKVG